MAEKLEKLIVGGGYVDNDGVHHHYPDREVELDFNQLVREVFSAPTVKTPRGKSTR